MTAKTPDNRDRTVADSVFHHVVADILSGSLRPRDKITERALVARFGASRTPIREAIKRLVANGFLETVPGDTTIVRDFTHAEIDELYQLRLWLERHAAALTVKNIVESNLQALRQAHRQYQAAVKQRDLGAMLELRAQFQAVCADATRNRWLATILITLRDKAYVVRQAYWQQVGVPQKLALIQEQMIDALSCRDLKAYKALVSDRVMDECRYFLTRLIPKPSESRLGDASVQPNRDHSFSISKAATRKSKRATALGDSQSELAKFT